jgi:hypothetical protein
VIAGAGGIEQTHVVMDPTGEPAEGVAVSRELTLPSSHAIINLIPKHQCFTNTGSAYTHSPPTFLQIIQ